MKYILVFYSCDGKAEISAAITSVSHNQENILIIENTSETYQQIYVYLI